MPTKTLPKPKNSFKPDIASVILQELRILRQEVTLLLPQEDWEGYEHPERIKRSYQKALKQYPPDSYGNSKNA